MDNQSGGNMGGMGNMGGNNMPNPGMGGGNIGGGEKSHKGIIIGLVVIVVLAGIFFYMQRPASPDTTETENAAAAINALVPGEVEITGSLACTPLLSGEALDEGECVMGLRGDDGMFYALDTMELEAANDTNLDGKVKISGHYSERAESEETGMYDYKGVIKVRTLESVSAQ